jgi:hypothetical protein
MHRAILIAGCLVAVIVSHARAADSDGTKPDDALTPGAVETTDLDIICHHSTKERRHTTQSQKNASFVLYGLPNHHAGWCAGPNGCSVDHRIPLECGGADDPKNLWPETGDGPFNQKDKNRLEGLCHKLVCGRQITPAEGQGWFLGDWTAEYRKRFGEP